MSREKSGAETTRVRLEAVEPDKGRPSARVLLAEDNPVNQRLMSLKLEEYGLEVDVACDGEQAVEMFRSGAYDLVLMDVSMPGVDGLEATRRIHALADRGRRTPVVALTAHALRADRQKIFEAGMVDYIPKPVDFGRLYRLLRRYLPLAEGREESDAQPLELSTGAIAAALKITQAQAASLIGRFLASAADQVQELRRALEARDRESAFRTAHRLRGTAGNLRLNAVAAAARRTESALRSHSPTDAGPEVADLHEALEQARACLDL